MSEPIDVLTGLPASFVRMLAIEVDPHDAAAPRDGLTEPLDNFFRALMRDHSFRMERKAAEAFRQIGPKEGQSL